MQMIKIGLSASVVCLLMACQDVKKVENDTSQHAQDNVAQALTASTVVTPPASEASQSLVRESKIASKPAPHPDIPQAVQDYVTQLQENCKPDNKVPMKDAVQLIHLWDDQHPEYLIKNDDLICYEYISDRGNSSGSDLTIFATMPNGETKQILNHVMTDYRIESVQPTPKIYLSVGGGYCGQNMDEISRSEAISCERLLEWDEASQHFVLGKMLLDAVPASQAKFE